MKRIFAHGALAPEIEGAVVAIGVFDGVHRGHQKVIARAVAGARQLHLPSVVVTFHPHPVEVLKPGIPFSYVTTLERRLQLIEAMGVDMCIVIDFSRKFAAQPPEVFVRDFLVGRLGVKRIVLGCDFQFGCQRAGTVDLLKRLGDAHGFDVVPVPLLKSIDVNIKSTMIKELIARGDLVRLQRFLGRRYDFLGEIEHGEARGRRLGYRTANFKQENVTILPPGIYFVNAQCADARVSRHVWHGLCYIGCKPTFNRKASTVVHELHLLDGHASLYGRKVRMEFFKKERDEIAFPDEQSLVRQMALDVLRARRFFHLPSPSSD